MFLSVLGNDMKSTDVIMWVMQPLMAVTVHDYHSHLGFVSCTLLHILLHARAER